MKTLENYKTRELLPGEKIDFGEHNFVVPEKARLTICGKNDGCFYSKLTFLDGSEPLFFTVKDGICITQKRGKYSFNINS